MIRRASAEDAAEIARLWNAVIRDTLATFNHAEKTDTEVAGLIAAREAAGHATFVAEQAAGAVIGFVTYSQFRGGVGYARTMEHTVILAEAARGRGTGRALMAAVEDHARAAGAHSIFAGVSSGNPEGRAFHAAIGYREVAVLKEVGFKWDRWLDLHLMQKLL